jgi:hypothetical protein
VWRLRRRNYSAALSMETETQPIRFVTANPNVPSIAFGSNLKYLHWDATHVERNGGVLLPGILNTSLASDLKKLSIAKVVLDASMLSQLQRPPFVRDAAERRRWINTHLSPPPRLIIKYPVMTGLRELSISVDTCYSIRLNDLINAVPNLSKLYLLQSEPNKVMFPENARWTGMMMTSLEPIVQHRNLRFLNLCVCLSTARIVGTIAAKFPLLLEELWIGHPDSNRLEFNLSQTTLLNMLESLKSLKRFKMFLSRDLHMAQVITHITDVQARLLWVELYHLRFLPCWDITGCEEYIRNKKTLHAKLRESSKLSTGTVLVSWWNHLLLGKHEHYLNSPEEETLRKFVLFLKQYRLPVQFTHLYHYADDIPD